MTNKSNEIVPVKSVNNVDITPVFNEIIEYAKDQATVSDIKTAIASVPKGDSLDWKLISGVLMNSVVEWVVENKDNQEVNSIDLIKHLQTDVGYLLKRLGLAT